MQFLRVLLRGAHRRNLDVNFNPSGLHGYIQIGDTRLKLRAFRESTENQLSNISTRAFVITRRRAS